MQSAILSLHIITVFQMCSLLPRTYFINERGTKYVSIYLNDDLKPQVNTGTSSGRAVLNVTECLILVTFKGNMPENEVQELEDLRQTLSMYCGRYISITSEKTNVHVSKTVGQTDGFNKCLHRQTSDKFQQTPRKIGRQKQ
jgi:hypothetical protein